MKPVLPLVKTLQIERVILVGPSFQTFNEIKKQWRAIKRTSRDRVIAVDGGADWLKKLRVQTDWWVGDGDSTKKKLGLKQNQFKLPREKDFSDFAMAFQFGLEFNPKVICLLGFRGGRKDHEFAVIQDAQTLMARRRSGWPEIRVIGSHEFLFIACVGAEWLEIPTPFRTFSLFTRLGVLFDLKGARYELTRGGLDLPSHGLSNQVAIPHKGVSKPLKIRVSGPRRAGKSANLIESTKSERCRTTEVVLFHFVKD